MPESITSFIQNTFMADHAIFNLKKIGLILGALLLSYISQIIFRRYVLVIIRTLVKRTKTLKDDLLVNRKVFYKLSYLVPPIIIHLLTPFIFNNPETVHVIQRALFIYVLLVGAIASDALLSTLHDIYNTFPISGKIPVKGYMQVLKLVIYFLIGIIILSNILNKSPVVFLSSLGAMTAILMIIFKDAIMGLIAGIQLTANNMVRPGDWIEMEKYGADGDVVDMSLTTIKVRNWDKTITTIPSYALISDSFKNWRGMQESGGRRIKRAVYIDMTSIGFCSNEMLERFKKIQYIAEYIDRKKREVDEYNKNFKIDQSDPVNGRRLTNIGIFRAYIVAYLKNHPFINKDMTFLVRQLSPTANGLPIEVYVFCSDKTWANYEAVQSDIFDHILAALPRFDLKVFQYPTTLSPTTLNPKL